MSYEDIIRKKIVDYDSQNADTKGLQNSDVRRRLIDESSRLIDEANWNRFRGDVIGGQWNRYLAEAYLNLAPQGT